MGIRSYGVDPETSIKFYKPLTIILGRNGSGKSTIIEAVKMATTGELPPMADKGAAFIHDPRIHNDTETKAKIRLLFTNVRGDQYIVSRHFQLALKKGPKGIGYKTEFKTLDQTVKRMDDGTASAFRCANLNAMLPDIMRVTKPVLNNVIFVHQEDSLWPLGDSKKLKEKFDEIFAATRYTKALDTIRKFRKDQNAELKTVNVELMHYEDKVKVLERVRAEVDEIKVKYDELRQGIDSVDTEISSLTAERTAMQVIADEHYKKRSQLSKLKIEGDIIEKDKAVKYNEMQLHLRDMDDDALVTEITELKTFLDRAGGERVKRERLIEDLRVDVEMKRATLHERQNQKGKLEQLSKMRAEYVSRLESMKEDFLDSELLAPGTEEGEDSTRLPSQSESFERWTESLTLLCREADAHVRVVSEKANENLETAATNLNEVRMRFRDAKSTSQREAEELRETRKKIAAIRIELPKRNESDSAIKDAESKFKTVQRVFQEKNENNRVATLELDITNLRKEAAAKKEDLNVLRAVRDELVQNQGEQARYDVCRETEGKRRKRAEDAVEDFAELLLSSISELDEEGTSNLSDLRGTLREGNTLTERNAEDRQSELIDAAAAILARKDAILRQADRNRNEAQAASKAASIRKAEQQSHFDDAKKELKAAERKMRTARSSFSRIPKTSVDIDNVTKLLQEVSISTSRGRAQMRQDRMSSMKETIRSAETAVIKATQKLSQLESGVLFAEGDLETFDNDPKHHCPACGVSSSKKVNEMRKSLVERVEYFKNPASTLNAQKDLTELGSTVNTLREVYVTGSKVAAVVDGFEGAQERFLDAEKNTRKLETDTSKAAATLEQCQERFGDGTSVKQIVSKRIELTQIFTDWDCAQREVIMLQTSLSATVNDTRSLSEVEEEARMSEERIQKVQDEVEKHARSLNRERDDLRHAENRVNGAKQKCLELQAMAEKHKRLRLEKEEASKKISYLTTHIEEVRNSMKNLEVDMEYAEAEHATVRAEGMKQCRESNDWASKRTRKVDNWNDNLREVQGYDRFGKERELEKVVMSLEAIEKEIECGAKDLRAHEKEQQTASDSQREMESRIRNLKDNQRYRDDERKMQMNARSARHVMEEIDVLERQAGGNPGEKETRMTEMINTKNAERAATMGEKQGYTNSYKVRKTELERAEREGSRRKFDECRIRKQTMELASSDLEKYHRALDQALMAFHTLKMNSINRTIKELWQQTYRGTDIEEIEIISDHGDTRGVAGGTLRRTFNYRVQMRQKQATLDMRGRCSAGQKVLACLVIRLALAESFCTDCGILALDEPTTNLDRENIDSLADALKTIIENRKKQRNFQLVLITHDQDFIDRLGARAFCDKYFLVYKDEGGISRAVEQELQEM